MSLNGVSKTISRYHNYLKMFVRNKDVYFFKKIFKKKNKITKNDKH